MRIRTRDILAHADAYSLAALGLFAFQCVLYRMFTIDDAFIAYRHARNFGHGFGPVMNPGERVEGVSSLPWTLALGLLSRLGLEPHRVAPVLSLACGASCVALTARLGRQLGGSARDGGVAALLCAAAAAVAIWSVSGMESLAYTLAILALVHAALSSSRRSGFGVGLGLGCVAALRPEGLLFALPLVGSKLGGRGASPRLLLQAAAGAALWVLPLELFRRAYYGDWLPNPAHAKGTLGAALLAPGALYAGKLLWTYPALVLACVFGLSTQTAPVRRFLGGSVAVLFGFALLVGGDRFPGYRFLLPCWPLLALGAMLAVRRAPSSRSAPLRDFAMIVAALAGALFLLRSDILLPVVDRLLPLARAQRGLDANAARLVSETRSLGVACIGLAAYLLALRRRSPPRSLPRPEAELRGSGRVFAVLLATLVAAAVFDPALRACTAIDPAARYGRRVGEWLRANVPPGTVVATNAAGSLPYFAQLPVIDMLGLTDHHIARQPASPGRWIGHEKGDGAYVLGRRPEIIILGGPEGSAEPWSFPGDQQLAASPEFRRDYRLRRVPLGDFDFVSYRRLDGAAVPP